MDYAFYSPKLVADINRHCPDMRDSGLSYVLTATTLDHAVGPLKVPGAQVRKTPDGKLDKAFYDEPKRPSDFDESRGPFDLMHYGLSHLQAVEKGALQAIEERKDLDAVSTEALHSWLAHVKRVLPIPMLKIAESCFVYLRDTCPTEERTLDYLGPGGPKESGTFFKLDDPDNYDCVMLVAEHSHNAYVRYQNDRLSFSTAEDNKARVQNMDVTIHFMQEVLPQICDHEYQRAMRLMTVAEHEGWEQLITKMKMDEETLEDLTVMSLSRAFNGVGMLAEISSDKSHLSRGQDHILEEAKYFTETLERPDIFKRYFGDDLSIPKLIHALPHDKYVLLDIEPVPHIDAS